MGVATFFFMDFNDTIVSFLAGGKGNCFPTYLDCTMTSRLFGYIDDFFFCFWVEKTGDLCRVLHGSMMLYLNLALP